MNFLILIDMLSNKIQFENNDLNHWKSFIEENKLTLQEYVTPFILYKKKFETKLTTTNIIASSVYKRYTIYKNDIIEILLITWSPNSKTLIHDHSKNGCILFLLEGELIEEKYKTENIELHSIHKVYPGDITFINNTIGYHRIINSNEKQYSYSIHIYSPPNHQAKFFV